MIIVWGWMRDLLLRLWQIVLISKLSNYRVQVRGVWPILFRKTTIVNVDERNFYKLIGFALLELRKILHEALFD